MPAEGAIVTGVAERLKRVLERDAPTWGIRPVPPDRRTLTGLDLAVLWGDLSVGLLVMVTGALLVPALGLGGALLAVLVGSVLGCVPLALVGLAGERERVPTMVLLRPALGARGSFLPSALNVVQLVGWTAVEFWAMGEVANVASTTLVGLDARNLWMVVVAIVCTGLALGGPIIVVRRWLERFGIYVLVGTAAWIGVEALGAGDLGSIWRAPGQGGLPFWLAVDLVVVMPVSWLPLAADYNRFARPGSRAVAGTYLGFLIGNAWFYALGVLLALGAGASADAVGIGSSIVTLAGGGVVLLALLVGESDNAFADIYSAAVSTQNVAPEVPQRRLVVAVGVAGLVLALVFTMETYALFLLLIGSVFVPLFGVFAADYFVRHRGRYGEEALFAPSGIRWPALVPWIAGFVVYHWCVATGPAGWLDAVRTVLADWLSLPYPLFGSRLGASLPSLGVAFGLALLLPSRERSSLR
jgi:putative hydroxymethylpyrimidine transporter CytX